MNVMISLVLAVSLATTPGPIARAVAREASQLAAGGKSPSEDARRWTRVRKLTPGTRIVITTSGSMFAARVFVLADESGILTLNLTGPALPADIAKTLRRMASESPERFAAVSSGPGFTDGHIQVGPQGILVDGQRVASLHDILDRTPRVDVREIRTAKSRSIGYRGPVAAAIGAFGGLILGGVLGATIENRIYPCHCDDPGLQGALVGMPVGAISGGVLGYYALREVGQDVIYRAP